METIIRPIRAEDTVFMNQLRITPGVLEDVNSLCSERIESNQFFYNNLNENDHVLVAEVIENNYRNIVGSAGLHVNRIFRQRHSATLGIMIHPAYQGKGIGKELMKKLMELSDNWLMLKRIELEVFADNNKAISLYKKFGFQQEGIKKMASIKNGKYVDVAMMARLKP